MKRFEYKVVKVPIKGFFKRVISPDLENILTLLCVPTILANQTDWSSSSCVNKLLAWLRDKSYLMRYNSSCGGDKYSTPLSVTRACS